MIKNILQSEEWLKFQGEMGKKVFVEKGEGFEIFGIIENTKVGKYIFCPYGPVFEDFLGFSRAVSKLKEVAKRERAIFIRVEPRKAFELKKMRELGLLKTHDIEPADTYVVDLSGGEEGVKERIPSRLLRYYRNTQKNGIKIEKSENAEDVKYLVKLQGELYGKKGLHGYSFDYYKKQVEQGFASLYLVRDENNNGEVLAVGIVFDFGGVRYNLQGAQSDEGRKKHATGVLTVQLILDAVEMGEQEFDFWGIAPEGAPADHPWAGFTGFKKTFVGEERHFGGTWDLPVNRVKYRAYEGLRKVKKMLR